ncbi:MAG: zinc ribbon domain-containing protein [Candidatus Adiutrix intracellularis]|nr:zinc ribbon domain-containing protein [Candidatus Adiutrix intracellularis]
MLKKITLKDIENKLGYTLALRGKEFLTMPIYEYQCQNCGETNESMQKFSDLPLKECPVCGNRMTKIMSMNSFKLKGSGWYATDYAGKKSTAPTTVPKNDSPIAPETKKLEAAKTKKNEEKV